jgi:serine acetyltransferase
MIRRLKRLVRSSRSMYLLRNRLVMAWKRRKYGLKHVHKTFYMNKHSSVCRDLIAHEYAFINRECFIGPNVELGRYVMFGPRVMIVGDDHVFDRAGVPTIFAGRPELRPTVIGDDAWVGAGCVIMAGVTIGARLDRRGGRGGDQGHPALRDPRRRAGAEDPRPVQQSR